MADLGHELTDEMLADLEKKIAREYAQAAKDMRKKLREYMEQFEEGKAKQKALLDAGKITKKEYKDWCFRHTMMGQQWRDMKNVLAEDLQSAREMALAISRGQMADVYALNANYATYQLEHDFRLDTGFTLYNHDTAEYLLKEQRQLMPGPSMKKAAQIAADKALQWDMQHIQSAVLQGVLQGESPYDVAKRLQGVAQMDYNASVRYARTMTTSAQNAGRYESYHRAKRVGVDLVLEWQATLDNRTRHEHRQMHGQRREVDEPFVVDGIEILYPGQSSGSGAEDIPQRLIWNCRCTILSWVKGFEGDTVTESPKMGDMSFDEWQDAKREEHPDPLTPETLDFKSRIEAIKQRISDNGGVISEDDLHEAGNILRDDYAKEAAERQKLYDKNVTPLEQKYDAAQKSYCEAAKTEWEQRQKYWKKEITRDEFEAYRKKTEDLASEKEKAWKAFKAEKDKYKFRGKASADWTRDKLAEIREMGSSGFDIRRHLNNSKSSVVPDIEYAYSHYPKDWVEASVNRGYLNPRKVSRGHYNDWLKELYISGTGDSAIETAFHELGHRFERAVPAIRDSEEAFYTRRTDGCPLERLKDIYKGCGYDPSEVTRKDSFIHAYMGKDYGGSAYELVSMGFEDAFMNPANLANDPDMQSWIYGLLLLL